MCTPRLDAMPLGKAPEMLSLGAKWLDAMPLNAFGSFFAPSLVGKMTQTHVAGCYATFQNYFLVQVRWLDAMPL